MENLKCCDATGIDECFDAKGIDDKPSGSKSDNAVDWFGDAFVFYGSHHHNSYNKYIHILCVWPILVTAMIFLIETPKIMDLSNPIPANEYVSLPKNFEVNGCLVLTAFYAVFYRT